MGFFYFNNSLIRSMSSLRPAISKTFTEVPTGIIAFAILPAIDDK